MIRLLTYAFIATVLGGGIVYLLADGLPEGAVAGAVVGLSIGLMVAVRRGAGDSAVSFEYEAAGIHDSNLTTTARRNLVREAYRTDAHQRLAKRVFDKVKETPQDRKGVRERERQVG